MSKFSRKQTEHGSYSSVFRLLFPFIMHPPDFFGVADFGIKRVIAARQIQSERYKKYSIHCNSQMTSKHLQQFCPLDNKCMLLLRQAISHLKLSPRAYDRILKVSRTIADLAASERITENHIFEAIQYSKTKIGED